MPLVRDENKSGQAVRKPRKTSSRVQEAKSAAANEIDKRKQDSVNSSSLALQNLTTSLERAEEKRFDALDALSDRLAVVKSPDLFMRDLLLMTDEKIAAANDQNSGEIDALEAQVESITAVIDDLGDTFSTIGSWDYSTSLPYAVAGAIAGV